MTAENSFRDTHLCVHCGLLVSQCVCTPESLEAKQYQNQLAFQQKVIERLDRIIALLEATEQPALYGFSEEKGAVRYPETSGHVEHVERYVYEVDDITGPQR